MVVTIVVLLILAGITITYVMGDNSVFKQASDAKLKTDIAKWQERLETAKAPNIIEGLGKFNPEKYFEYIEQQGIIEDKETDVEDKGNGIYDVTTKPGYIFEVELIPSQDNPTDAKIEYIGQAGKIAPIIKKIETSATSSSITVKAIVTRLGNGTVTYYYKLKTETDSEYKEITNVNSETGATQSTGIVAGTEYVIKVVARNDAGEAIDTAEITATKIFVESMTIIPNPATVKETKTVTLTVDIKPENATNKNVTWTSKNRDIATVNDNGVVTGVKEGTATIEVASTDGSNKSVTCTVTVTPPTVADIADKIQTTTKTVEDENGNKVVIPGGFKVVPDTTDNDVDYTYSGDKKPCVQDGIVIEDEEGNQFVWIPVGEIKNKDKTTTTIVLGRYLFEATNETPTLMQNADDYKQVVSINNSYDFQELAESSTNTPAKNLEDFITKTKENRGYYLGRYEASQGEDGKAKIQANKTTWINITQPDSAIAAQRMYDSSYVESDLINSYSWDTAILFIQKYSDNSNYAQKLSEHYADTLTGMSGDKASNIHDMASHYYEWSTEHCDFRACCTYRGGDYFDSAKDRVVTSSRGMGYLNTVGTSNGTYIRTTISFRPILYIK